MVKKSDDSPSESKIGHEPKPVHGPKQSFLRQPLGLGLDCMIRHQSCWMCISRLGPEGNEVFCCVGRDLCSSHGLTLCTFCI